MYSPFQLENDLHFFKMSKHFQSKNSQLNTTGKIILQPTTMPLHIGMNEPAALVICNPEDDIFLFTTGLGPCIAILAFCQLNSGKKIIGIAHMSGALEDFPKGFIKDWENKTTEEIKFLIKDGFFTPQLIKNLLLSISSLTEYASEPIDVYFAGGDHQREFNFAYFKFYCEYINACKNAVLKGTLFNPFELVKNSRKILKSDKTSAHTKEAIEIFDRGLSLTAGITSDGKPLCSKLYNVSFGFENFSFRNGKELIDYFLENKYQFPPSNDFVCGFQNLTVSQLNKFREECFDFILGDRAVIAKPKAIQEHKQDFVAKSITF